MLIATFDGLKPLAMPFALEANVQISILFLLAAAGTLTLSRSSAAVRHRIWSLVFCSLFLMPALSAIVPRWTLPVIEKQALEPFHGKNATIEPGADTRWMPENELPSSAPLSKPMEREADVNTASIPTTAVSSRRSFDAAKWLTFLTPSIWVIGFIAMIGQLMRSQRYKRRLQSDARIVDDEDWNVLLNSVKHQLGIKRRVRLYQSQDENIPVTWGVFRPLIMLPLSATNWPDQRRRYVLTHELSHIQRCDLPFQIVAHLCCALYWFNPLLWYGYWRLCTECEQACDDSVVQHGSAASDYAAELVRLAKELCAVQAHAAVAMTRTTNLEQRIKALFDRTKSHLPLSLSSQVSTLVAVMTLVFFTTTLRPESRSVAEDKPPKSDQAVTTSTKVTAVDESSTRTSPNPLVHILQPVPKNTRVDLSGDPIPDGMIQRLGGTRFKVPGWWREFAFAANDEWIWLKAHDKVSVIHRETGRNIDQQQLRLGNARALHLGVSGDGNRVAIDMSNLRQTDADNQFDLRIVIISAITTSRHQELTWKSRRPISSICLDHDGLLLLTASQDEVCVWNVETGKPLYREAAPGGPAIPSAAFARDGKSAVVGGHASAIIWSFEKIPAIAQVPVLQGTATCIAPNGRTFATLGHNEVHVWDAESCNVMASLVYNEDHRLNADFGFSFSPDNKLLAVPSVTNQAIELWDVELTECVKKFPVHRLRGAVFSRNGRWLATAGDDSVMTIIDLQTDKQISQPSIGHDDNLWGICFIDGNSLVSSCTDARIWDLKSATQRKVMAHKTDALHQQVAVSPDGKRIVTTGPDSIGVWESATGALLLSIPTSEGFRNTRTVQFNADGSRFATWGGDDAKLRWFNITDGTNAATFEVDIPGVQRKQELGRLGGRGAGVHFVHALTAEKLFVFNGSDLVEFDAITGERQRKVPLNSRVFALAASRDGRWIAISEDRRQDGGQCRVVLRDLKTMEIVRQWSVVDPGEPSNQVDSPFAEYARVLQGSPGIVFSSDSKHVAWSRYGTRFGIDVVNVEQDSLLAQIPIASASRCLRFSPDGTQLASGHDDSTISVWDWNNPTFSAKAAASAK